MPDIDVPAGSLLPTSLEDLRGQSPEEMRNMIEVIDAHLRSLDANDAGELREMSEEEEAVAEQLVSFRDLLMKRIEKHNKMAEILRQRPEPVKRAIANIRYGLPDGTGLDVMRMTNRESQDHAMRSLDDRLSTEHMEDDQKEQVAKTIRKNPTIARRVLVTETDAYRNAWMKMVTQPHPMLDDEERAAINRWYEFRAASENTTTAGGFGVPVNQAA